jgi:hypothetical protein
MIASATARGGTGMKQPTSATTALAQVAEATGR